MASDILFEQADWPLLPEIPDDCVCGWVNAQGLVIGLRHLGRDKLLRERLADLEAMRDRYRTRFAAQGMGLVESDILNLDGAPAVRTVAKLLLEPTRAAYAGTIALPLPTDSYVFNLAAVEPDAQAARDQEVWLSVSENLQRQGYTLETSTPLPGQPSDSSRATAIWKNFTTGSVLSWAQDPYRPNYQGPCLRTMAEAADYDTQFPTHPLSQIRAALQCLASHVRLSPDLKRRLHSSD
jgi:hypothetical protein